MKLMSNFILNFFSAFRRNSNFNVLDETQYKHFVDLVKVTRSEMVKLLSPVFSNLTDLFLTGILESLEKRKRKAGSPNEEKERSDRRKTMNAELQFQNRFRGDKGMPLPYAADIRAYNAYERVPLPFAAEINRIPEMGINGEVMQFGYVRNDDPIADQIADVISDRASNSSRSSGRSMASIENTNAIIARLFPEIQDQSEIEKLKEVYENIEDKNNKFLRFNIAKKYLPESIERRVAPYKKGKKELSLQQKLSISKNLFFSANQEGPKTRSQR
jgi:hypothetical protein